MELTVYVHMPDKPTRTTIHAAAAKIRDVLPDVQIDTRYTARLPRLMYGENPHMRLLVDTDRTPSATLEDIAHQLGSRCNISAVVVCKWMDAEIRCYARPDTPLKPTQLGMFD